MSVKSTQTSCQTPAASGLDANKTQTELFRRVFISIKGSTAVWATPALFTANLSVRQRSAQQPNAGGVQIILA